MKEVKIGIIGLGAMGRSHAKRVINGDIPGMRLTAVCDVANDLQASFPEQRAFRRAEDLMESGEADAILIATPHFSHVGLSISALERGLHVLVEKPVAVHKAECDRLLQVQRHPGQIFAAGFCLRLQPWFQKMKQLIDEGELGEIRRVHWTVTTWYRTQAYYDAGGWRGTWKGEGGGVLLNQCPHQLDLWQWLFGMPAEIYAVCSFGRYHTIEVEDDVTAVFKYPGGKTGLFVASTGESPGTNRLEVVGEKGKLVIENDTMHFSRNEVPMTQFSRSSKEGFASPPVSNIEISSGPAVDIQKKLLENFASSILHGVKVTAPAEEGVRSVELANAILLSSIQGTTLSLPLDSVIFERELNRLMGGKA